MKEYIKIHKKRVLHIFLCCIIGMLFPIGGLILFIIKEGMTGAALAYNFFIFMTLLVTWNLRDYRDWIEKKYPKEKEEIEQKL